jgi:hypothetical protein
MMDQYSESESESKRPGRIQRRQQSRLQSRPETAFIPKRRIPGLTHVRPDDSPDLP